MACPVYQGKNSCYAKREGVWVKRIRRLGVDTFKEACALAYCVLYDYYRGYTYDNDNGCRKIRMTEALADKRLNFIKRLARLHKAPKEVQKRIDRMIDFVMLHYKMKPLWIKIARTMMAGRKDKIRKMFSRRVINKIMWRKA